MRTKLQKLFLTICYAFLLFKLSHANGNFKTSDSLQQKSFKELNDKYLSHPLKDSIIKSLYSKALLLKAKEEGNTLEMARAYRYMSFNEFNNISLRITYLDSSINVSKNLNHKKYPAVSYSNLGGLYFTQGNYSEALANYLKALEYAEKNKNPGFTFMTNHNIALLKSRIGEDWEAIKIFQKVLNYEKSKGLVGTMRINTLLALADSYRKLKFSDSASIYYKKAIDFSINKHAVHYHYGVLGEGMNLYEKGKYEEALDSITKAIPFIENNDFIVMQDFKANGYLYRGKVYLKLNQPFLALKSLNKLDEFLFETKFTSLESREGYEILISYFKKTREKDKELLYTRKLIRYDSLLYQNFKTLTHKIIKEYDTPLLLEEEKKLIQALKKEKRKTSYGLLVSIFIGLTFLGVLVFTYLKKLSYKKRYNNVLQKLSKKSDLPNFSNDKEDIGISKDIVTSILEQLVEFEAKRGYLLPNITVGKIALDFKTNSRYLSKVINSYKKKSFVSYINELRVTYVAQELKENKKYRN